MASRRKTGTTRRVSSLALMDTVSAFMRAYKTRMRGLLTHVSSGESSPSRVMVVVVLHKSGALPMGTIAAHTGLPKSNITAIVDDLEAEGLLAIAIQHENDHLDGVLMIDKMGMLKKRIVQRKMAKRGAEDRP